VLTREGETVDHLYYLAEGEARVMSMGSQVGLCRPGDLTASSPSCPVRPRARPSPSPHRRVSGARPPILRPYVEAHDDIRRAIEHGFATVLKAKLRASNRTIIEAAGHPTTGSG
jgi:hypothetical protein